MEPQNCNFDNEEFNLFSEKPIGVAVDEIEKSLGGEPLPRWKNRLRKPFPAQSGVTQRISEFQSEIEKFEGRPTRPLAQSVSGKATSAFAFVFSHPSAPDDPRGNIARLIPLLRKSIALFTTCQAAFHNTQPDIPSFGAEDYEKRVTTMISALSLLSEGRRAEAREVAARLNDDVSVGIS